MKALHSSMCCKILVSLTSQNTKMHEEGSNGKNPDAVLEIKNVDTWWGLKQRLSSLGADQRSGAVPTSFLWI